MRRQELWRSCSKLGIPESNIVLMNATNLPDDPNVDWRPDAVAGLILHAVESLSIQAIFTFDRDGVSSHPNHCAVYYAAASLCLANLLPKGERGGTNHEGGGGGGCKQWVHVNWRADRCCCRYL